MIEFISNLQLSLRKITPEYNALDPNQLENFEYCDNFHLLTGDDIASYLGDFQIHSSKKIDLATQASSRLSREDAHEKPDTRYKSGQNYESRVLHNVEVI